MKNRILTPFLLAFLVLATSTSLLSQTFRGSIRGAVRDANDRPIAGALLKLFFPATGESRTATTGGSGEFAFTLLPPGAYRIEVEQTGFKKTVYRIDLEVNEAERVDPILDVGTLSDEIQVDAPRAALKRDSASLGAVIDNQQVTGLPLDGRNFLELSLLVPGAAPAAQGSAGTVRGDFAFNINGGREDSNAYLLDGVYNIDPKLNAIGVRPPVDAVREFEVLAGTYDATFGRNAGAQINVVLKSGSNRFHGTAYEFFRNQVLDARNFFAPSGVEDPQYQRNQFGFSLGGPIIRNRTFFFADYEGTRLREGITRVTNVPTLAERRGDFSQSLFARPPFPGGIIPDFLIDPLPGA
jgi:Carboxypeptidase regulatory-like domain